MVLSFVDSEGTGKSEIHTFKPGPNAFEKIS